MIQKFTKKKKKKKFFDERSRIINLLVNLSCLCSMSALSDWFKI